MDKRSPNGGLFLCHSFLFKRKGALHSIKIANFVPKYHIGYNCGYDCGRQTGASCA